MGALPLLGLEEQIRVEDLEDEEEKVAEVKEFCWSLRGWTIREERDDMHGRE